ncbi:MAG: IS1595 family transposase [Bacteroidota bacterium]
MDVKFFSAFIADRLRSAIRALKVKSSLLHMIKSLHQCRSLFELRKAFNTDLICRQYLEIMLWDGASVCPHCATSDKIYKLKNPKLYKCGHCRKQFTVTVGTIFHGTHVPLNKWFEAIWCVTNKAKGIASTQLADEIGVQQRTAWFMLGRIRFALKQKSFMASPESIVEVDATFVGPRAQNMHEYTRWKLQRKTERKKRFDPAETHTAVFGMIERGGKVKTVVVEGERKKITQKLIDRHIEPGATIYSDGHRAYKKLSQEGYTHDFVSHQKGQYVKNKGTVHINSIEGYWGLFKRGYIGVSHHMSDKHLQSYFNEYDFRHNHKKLPKLAKLDEVLKKAFGGITYKQLTQKVA